MIKAIDYVLGWFAELADSARDMLGFIPALGATLVLLLFINYISVRCTKGILRFVLLTLSAEENIS